VINKMHDKSRDTTPGSVSAASPVQYGATEYAAIRKLTLVFRDSELESRFRHEQLQRSLPVIRLALFCGIVLYALFGVLDWYLIERNLDIVLAIRFCFGIGLMSIFVGLTYSRRFLDYAQIVLSLAMLSAGLAIVAMTAIIDRPAAETYYAGLIMVIIYAATLVRIRFVHVIAVSLIIAAAYFAVATLINPIPRWALVSNMFFLTMTVGVGIFASYALELSSRQKFAHTVALENATDVAIRLRNEAVSANNAKTEFLATMSHELRTPLNAVLGFSEVMKAEMFGPIGSPRYREYASDIHNSAEHLLAIINDILDITKADAGRMELEENDVDASNILRNAIRICYDLAAKKGVRVTTEFPEWTPVVRVDKRLMQQVVVNLLSNAIKFTPSAGEVNARLYFEDGGACRIAITDTGIGIPAEDQERVFEPFTQLQDAFARDHGGTGLGLPLVRRITELHGGQVWLSSRLGEGTQVVVELPKSRTAGFAELQDTPVRTLKSA
jgi:signal transduction histidine kinase